MGIDAQGVSHPAITAESARAVVTEFFHHYAAHDVDGMSNVCSLDADFDYIPIELWGQQRVQRAGGKVGSIGKVVWHGLISSFPDQSPTIRTMAANANGDVVAQVDIAGTQKRTWGFVASTGRHFVESHLFVFHVGEAQLIDSITAYWDDASISQQLGHLEID